MAGGTEDRWEAFLTPDLLRGKLISAAIYLTAYEFLVDSIVERLKSLFTEGFNETGWIVSPKYETKVLARNKSKVHASLEWLVEHGAIDASDVAVFMTLKDRRNEIAHKLTAIVSGESDPRYLEQFPLMVTLLDKIERWWIVGLDLAINPELADVEVDEAGIVPQSVWTLQLLIDVALGDPEKASAYLAAFKKHRASAAPRTAP